MANLMRSNNPEVIGSVRKVTEAGDDICLGDRVVGIQVMKKESGAALVQLDVRQFGKNVNLIVEIELPEIVTALSVATLHAETL